MIIKNVLHLWHNKAEYQYGVPMKDFLLARVAVICADTPKSAAEKNKEQTFTTTPQAALI